MIDKERLAGKLASCGITLDSLRLDRLDRYAGILVDYNEKVNLTAITDPEGIEDRHFVDSIVLRSDPLVAGRVADIGTGNGIPGIVVKIVKPDVDIFLMDPLGKRCTFLKYALDELGLKGEVIKERAEEAARKAYRESYDVVTARAVAEMRVLSEYCIPLVREGGWFIPMKGPIDGELEGASRAITLLGGEAVGTKEYVLPDSSKRSLIYIRKVKKTPPVYPRNGGKIAKSPL